MEASGHARWFERLLGELQFELWIGEPAAIQSKRGRKQKTDRQDAEHILKLMLKDDFPRIWVPSGENRDLRQLLWHRHRMVQARTRIMNQLQAVAINEGLRCKKRLWRTGRQQLALLRLAPWASRRRHDLLELLDRLNPTIAELSQAIEQEAAKCAEARRLMTHPGVGALTALAFVLIIGDTERFQCGKQVASYLGLVPLEKSSGNGDGWATSPNKEIRCCASCWWKRPKSRCGACQNGAASISICSCGGDGRQRKWRWRAAWGLICTGCGVSNEITSRKVRFARRTARNRRWCAIEHREIDWASCSPSRGV